MDLDIHLAGYHYRIFGIGRWIICSNYWRCMMKRLDQIGQAFLLADNIRPYFTECMLCDIIDKRQVFFDGRITKTQTHPH